jgi:hypothetical protein
MYFNPDYASLLSSVWITNFGRLEPRRERRESAFESQTRESEIRDRDCELEKVDNLMEDIQFSSAVEGSLAPAMNEAAHNSVAAESIETGLDMPSKVQDGLAPMSHGPKMTVQVVIEQKSVAKVEEPILPDHYYDNGNVPVFKPVCVLVVILTIPDNGSIPRF